MAIGKFDGMHRGHKTLLSEILEAKKRGLQAVVFTFDPPPAVLFSGKAVKGLTTREEKETAVSTDRNRCADRVSSDFSDCGDFSGGFFACDRAGTDQGPSSWLREPICPLATGD